MMMLEQWRCVVYRGCFVMDAVEAIDWRTARDAALKSLQALYQKPAIAKSADGDEIIVSYGGLKHALSKGIPSLEKTLVSLHIQKIITSARKIRTEPDRNGRKDPSSISYYETRARIDEDFYEICIIVRNHSDGKRHYDHALVKGKAHQGYSRVRQEEPVDSPTRPYGGLLLSLQEIKALVNKFTGGLHGE